MRYAIHVSSTTYRLDPTIYSIQEGTRSFLLKAVRGIDLFVRICLRSHVVCLQVRMRQKPLRTWATPMKPVLCFPECLLVNLSKTLLVITPPFYNSIVIPLLTYPFQNIKLKSGAAAAQESRVSGAVEQGSKYVFLSNPYLTPHLIINSLMYFVPLGLLGAYFAWRYYTTGSA